MRSILLGGRATLALIFCGLALVALPGGAHGESAEALHYHWRLQGLIGALAGLFFPRSGYGSLTTTGLDDGHVRCELIITGEDDGPDFWRYGAELDPVAGRTVRAWTAYHFRNRDKAEESKLEDNTDAGVVDIASSIQLLRHKPVAALTQWRIWSDGHLYSVEVVPGNLEQVRVGPRQVPARHFLVRPAPSAAERAWKGRLELWLAQDPVSTPVRIIVERGLASVLLELQPDAGDSARAPHP